MRSLSWGGRRENSSFASGLEKRVGRRWQRRVSNENESRNARILLHRVEAHKIAHALLKRWNARIESEEVGSISDLALCEAAKCYDENKGTNFLTYVYFYIKGFLIREISERRHGEFLLNEGDCVEQIISVGGSESELRLVKSKLDGESDDSPERAFLNKELLQECVSALVKLPKLEQEIVFRVHVLDYKVAAVARQLGYSRGHISETRRQAFKRLRVDLEAFRPAA